MAGEKRERYHHGELRTALVDAALALLSEGGAANLTVREAARRAGVSPAAPFRHFNSRAALLAAVAEEALGRLVAEVTKAVERPDCRDPLERYHQIGLAYLRWAFSNPTHFEVISTPSLFDLEEAGGLRQENQKLIAMTEQALREAAAQDLLATTDVPAVLIAGRALVYGLARMKLDGHFPRWGVEDEAVNPAAVNALALFIDGLRRH